MLALKHLLPYRSSLGCLQAESIRTPLPTCRSEPTTADARPTCESGQALLIAFMALTPASEEARGQDGRDPELQCHIYTPVASADDVAVDVANRGYQDVSMQRNTRQLCQCGTSCCNVVFGSSCRDSYVLP